MTEAANPAPVSWGRRLSICAEESPDEVATYVIAADGAERPLTWRELDDAARRFAGVLEQRGVSSLTKVVVGLPRVPEHLVATFAAWKLGACVVALRND